MHLLFAAFLFLSSLLPGHASPQNQRIDHVTASIVHLTGEKDVMSFFGPAHVHYSCTGFVIAENRVLTAAHCMGDHMRTDGHLLRTVIKADEKTDLAVLDTPTLDRTNSQKPPLPLRDQPLVRLEPVMAVGYAFGFDKPMATFHTVAILAYTPDADDMAPGTWVTGGYHQGMSGGPLVDEDGYVVGVVQQAADGVGYSVPTLTIRAFLLGTM